MKNDNHNEIIAIVLTRNEELHLDRCLKSLKKISSQIIVVDCFSTDNTEKIALENGVTFLQRAWTSHSDQFNWALEQINKKSAWVLRLDADEYLTEGLIETLNDNLSNFPIDITGITINRQIVFMGKKLRFGGIGSIPVLRMFRLGKGFSESRLMDEHIKVQGKIAHIDKAIVDENLQPLSWWVEKHNAYASFEAIEHLNQKYHFLPNSPIAEGRIAKNARLKRWIKINIYHSIAPGARAVCYFLYRYIFLIGFLDGRSGFIFHFMQGLWYRLLVDLKISEVQKTFKSNGRNIIAAIKSVLAIDV